MGANIQNSRPAVRGQDRKSSFFQSGGNISQNASLTIGDKDNGFIGILHITHYMPLGVWCAIER